MAIDKFLFLGYIDGRSSLKHKSRGGLLYRKGISLGLIRLDGRIVGFKMQADTDNAEALAFCKSFCDLCATNKAAIILRNSKIYFRDHRYSYQQVLAFQVPFEVENAFKALQRQKTMCWLEWPDHFLLITEEAYKRQDELVFAELERWESPDDHAQSEVEQLCTVSLS